MIKRKRYPVEVLNDAELLANRFRSKGFTASIEYQRKPYVVTVEGSFSQWKRYNAET